MAMVDLTGKTVNIIVANGKTTSTTAKVKKYYKTKLHSKESLAMESNLDKEDQEVFVRHGDIS